jgi:hypothetical protein
MIKNAPFASSIAFACCLNAACTSGSMSSDTIEQSNPDGANPDGGPYAGVEVFPEGTVVCSIIAAITALPGGHGSGSPPATHTFSVALDQMAKTVTTGANGNVQQVVVVAADDGWTTQAAIAFKLASGSYPELVYSKLRIRSTPAGCTGSGSGTYHYQSTDIIYRKDFTAELTGVVDKVGPELSVFSGGGGHPLAFTGVMANEVLPAGTTADLLYGTDGVVRMTSLPTAGTTGISGFSLSGKALAFGTTYSMRILPAAVDVAGNQAAALPSFTTLADPGLFAQDGFEGTLNAYFTGGAAIADRSMVPIPTGNKALIIPPSNSGSCSIRFTARLSVPANAKSIKFSRFTYGPDSTGGSLSNTTLLALPNGDTAWPEETTTPMPFPSKIGLADSVHDVYGDSVQVEIPLPPGTGSEIMFDISRSCHYPPSSSLGLVIDDLRVE